MHFIISTSFACLLLCESEETLRVSSSLEILTGFPDKGLYKKTSACPFGHVGVFGIMDAYMKSGASSGAPPGTGTGTGTY